MVTNFIQFLPAMAFPPDPDTGAVLACVGGDTYARKDAIKAVAPARWNKYSKTWDVQIRTKRELAELLRVCDGFELCGTEVLDHPITDLK